MINFTKKRHSLNFEKKSNGVSQGKELVKTGELDNLISKSLPTARSSAYNVLNESNEFINNVSTDLFNRLGIVTVNGGFDSKLSLINRVNLYLDRFPEIEYLIDMLASSIIYTSSSNKRKIEVNLFGEYKVLEKKIDTRYINDSTTSDSTDIIDDINVPNIEVDQLIYNNNVEKVDSHHKEISLAIGNLLKRNNIKLSLYNLVNSILRYGCGIFYFDDVKTYSDVSFYSLDEVVFKETSNGNTTINSTKISNDLLESSGNSSTTMFKTIDEDDHLKKITNKNISIFKIEDGTELKSENMFFIAEKGVIGKSQVDKVINYLKVIELLELSLLIERLSKSKTTHIWKLDLEKIEDEDIANTLMLYRNLVKSKSAMNFDETTDQMSFDIVKNLIDSNLIVPTEGENLKIDTLKSEYKPLLDDIDYWQDKVYHTMGIPLHYRKSSNAKTYQNNSMLALHDNVYSMKIRHYQVMLNNILTFQMEKQLGVNYKDLDIKYLNVNIPEFVPMSERKETDLDKSSKFVTMFTQLEQMLGMNIKDEFILNKLFPNDVMSDILEDITDEDLENNIEPVEDEDILSLFESGNNVLTNITNKNHDSNKFKRKRSSRKINLVSKSHNYSIYSYDFKLNVIW